MSEVFEHNVGDHEDPLTGPVWIVGLLGVVLVIVITLGLTALYYNAVHEEEREKLIERQQDELRNLRASQQRVLTDSPRWVERRENEQIVQSLVIPLDQAMELVVRDYSQAKDQPK